MSYFLHILAVLASMIQVVLSEEATQTEMFWYEHHSGDCLSYYSGTILNQKKANQMFSFQTPEGSYELQIRSPSDFVKGHDVFRFSSFLCLEDQQNSRLLHMDFILNRKSDVVTLVYAHGHKDCAGTSEDGGQIFKVRVTFVIDNTMQIFPPSPCGMTTTPEGSYELQIRSEASSGLVTATDTIYTFKCNASNRVSSWVQTSGIRVGSVDLLNLTSSRTVNLQVVSPTDTNQVLFVATLGTPVQLKFTMTFTSAFENIDVLGARLKSLICSPSDTFLPIRRTLIDDNGCAVNYTEKALALSGPFTTESNGSSPFIAFSPVFEIGRFSGSYELNFLVYIEYCTSILDSCFTDMCISRRKRSAEGVEVVTARTKINVYQQSDSTTTQNSNDLLETHNCYLTWMFATVAGSVFFLLSIDSCAIGYLVKQLKGRPTRMVHKRPTVIYPRANTRTTLTTFF